MSTTLSLLQLPVDILVHILKYLSYSDLRNMMLCCKSLKNIISEDNVLWKHVFRDVLVINKVTSMHSRPSSMNWYHKCRISHNWLTGIYRSKVLLQHQEKYMPWLHYQNQFIILSVGSELRCYHLNNKGQLQNKNPLWYIEVPKILRRDVRTNDISRFIISNNLLVCGNRDGCVAVYQFNNLYQKPLLLHHIVDCHQNGQVEVSAVELITRHNPTVISASYNDPKLKFWRVDSRESRNITIDCTGLKCLALDSDQTKLAVGVNANKTCLVVVDTESEKTLYNNNEVTQCKGRDVIRDVQWHDAHTAAYVTHSGHLQAFDCRTGQVVYTTIDPFQSTLYCLKTDGDHAVIVGSSEYSRCVLYDIRNTRHLQMYFTQKKSSPIYSLDFDTTKLLAAADVSVAVLNFNISVSNVEEKDYSHVFEWVS